LIFRKIPLSLFIVAVLITIYQILVVIYDPHGSRMSSIPGRVSPSFDERYIKLFHYEEVKPDILILGNSVSAFAYHNDQFENYENKFYNLSMSGASIKENYLYFKKALKVHTPKRIIWHIMPRSLYGPQKVVNPDIFESSLGYEYMPSLSKYWYVFRKSLSFSGWKSLKSKIKSNNISIPYKGRGHMFDEYGSRDKNYNFYSVKKRGYQYMFDRAVKKNLAHYENNHLNYIENMKLVSAVFSLCEINECDIDVVFHPTHKSIYSARGVKKMSSELNSQLTDLLMVSEKYDNVDLYDFSLPLGPNLEDISDDPEHIMKWWWEAIHITHNYGAQIVNTIKQNHTNCSLGYKVTMENIQSCNEQRLIMFGLDFPDFARHF